MPPPNLKEFASPVPICKQTAGLATVLEIFRSSGCDAIVVVSEQQRPLGIVNIRQVMPHLLSRQGFGETPVAMATGDFYKPLSQLEPPIIEPVVILSAQLSLSQFWVYLQLSGDRLTWDKSGGSGVGGLEKEVSTNIDRLPTTSSQCPMPNAQGPITSSQHWVLVDGDGKFLGLLNNWLILQYVAPKFTQTDIATSASIQPQATDIKPLVQVLEQLPLPMSLQTSTGEVLAQNLTWRQQIGTSPDLEWVRRTTAAMLESPSVDPCEALLSAMSDTLGSIQGEPDTVGNAVNQRCEHPTQADVQRYCAIDTPRIAAAISQRRAIGSAQPMSKIQDTEASWEASVPGSQTRQKSQERVFSFVKMPLLPLVNEREKVTHLEKFQPSPQNYLTSDLWLVLAQDTTEQQQVAQELTAKNAELLQLNRLKDEFLACISHELKTPLTAVLGLSSLLKDQALGALNERQVRYARLIYQSGRQLMTVVNDILDLTRMETGQLELTLEPVHIQNVCDRAYSQVRQFHSEKDPQEEEFTPETQFSLEIEPGLEMLVADELRLRQMLVHLLSNAFKFTDPGGEIGLRVNRWEGWIAFTLWDTGIGIPPEKQHLIFQKFQQLEQPRTRRFEGTGLGLVLTQRLARLHGGDISFISTDKGSEFTLLLPSCPPQRTGFAASPPSWTMPRCSTNGNALEEENADTDNWGLETGDCSLPNLQSSSRNRLVLIVEAVPRYLESLTEQLNKLAYRVVIARSGPEAIEKARSLQPCAILLNPLLPQLSGWDVLTLLKSDAQICHIPVLVTATQAEKQQAYHNKADGFLSLPVQEQALLESLSSLGKQELPTSRSLTILHLTPELVEARSDSSVLSSELAELLSLQQTQLNYRVLEADDLDQAELLVRVWHPDVVILDSARIGDPLAYLQQFALHHSLTSLPLVTLDRQTTEAANQISGLCVYPCLASDDHHKIASLLQVIEVAAGLNCMPSILVMEVSAQQQEPEMSKVERRSQNKTLQQRIRPRNSPDSLALTPHSSWLQALTQYLQAAGFRSSVSCSWTEVYRQLQEQSVDLLLIRLKDISNSSALVKGLMSLAQLQKRPPILILDHRSNADSGQPCHSDCCASAESNTAAMRYAPAMVRQVSSYGAASLLPTQTIMPSANANGHENSFSEGECSPLAPEEVAVATEEAAQRDEAVGSVLDSNSELESLLRAVATQILRGHSQSMAQLLDQINQNLAK